MANKEPVHTIESELGEDFLHFADWVEVNGTPEQLKIALEAESADPDKVALYNAWVKDQKIVKHTVEEDGELTVNVG